MRLLLVEDDVSLAAFIQKGLQEERYAVDVGEDGDEGLQLATRTAYDLVILDVMLPKQNGLAVCRKLRAQGHTVPILLLTVRDSVEDKVAGLDCGADDYLAKPFAFAELLARVRALLRRGAIPAPGLLTLGDMDLDPAAHRVWRCGREITLTSKEYAILEYLLRNANRVLTRTAIIEHVWDIHYDSMTNIVDVHIRALRAKIDRPFSNPLIKTVRGVGYMLQPPRGK